MAILYTKTNFNISGILLAMMDISVNIDGAVDAIPPIQNWGNLKHSNQYFEHTEVVLLAP